MRKVKKLLSLIFAIAMLSTVMSITVFNISTNALTSGGYTYFVVGSEATITDAADSISGDVTVPKTLGGYTVTSIGDSAYAENENITSVTIPNSVTYIGNSAFYECKNIQYVTIPGSVAIIGEFAFYSNDIRNLILPEGVTEIEQCAFAHNGNLSSVTVPKSFKKVGSEAFDSCSNLNSVFYRGSKTLREEITGVTHYYNGEVVDANWYYNSCIGKANHSYSNSCDTVCNRCSVKRSIKHTYTNDCDTTCNVCKVTRKITHSYKPATCTKPKTCKVCGVTSGKALGHKYDSGKITKKPTCVSTGVKTFTCKTCKVTKTSKVAKTKVHEYTNACDKKCNLCGITRKVGAHKYTNKCDTSCNICGAKRKIKHTYSNACDASCNICKATRSITHNYKAKTTKASLTKDGKTIYKCSKCGKVASNYKIIKRVTSVTLSTTEYPYNGKVRQPNVVVKDAYGSKLKKNVDYTVTYAKGRKNVGTYKVTIKMKGKYSGKRILTFKIVPTTKKSITVLTGSNTKINAKSNQKIKYSSSNTKVAKVTSKGVIIAVKKGKATITVKSGKITKKISVVIQNPSVQIYTYSSSMYVGDDMYLYVTTNPKKAKVTWSVSNKKLAKISSSGKLTAKAKGTVTVTVKIKYKGKTYKDTYKITIKEEEPNIALYMEQSFSYRNYYTLKFLNYGTAPVKILSKGTVYCNGTTEDIDDLQEEGYYYYTYEDTITVSSYNSKNIRLVTENYMQFYTVYDTCVDFYIEYRGKTYLVTAWSIDSDDMIIPSVSLVDD